MTSKKIQNFVRSKVSTGSNVSKAKLKSDSLEEPLIFNNIESDFDNKKNNLNSDKDLISSIMDENTPQESKPSDDFEILPTDSLALPEVSTSVPIRLRVESLGRSVNMLFKEAQTVMNATNKDTKKRIYRKPSEIAKYKSKNSSRKKTVEAPESQERSRSKSFTRIEDTFKNIVTDPIKYTNNAIENEGYISDMHNTEDPKPVFQIAPNNTEYQDTNDVASTIEDTETSIEAENVDNINNNVTNDGINFTNLKILASIGGFLAIFFLFSISKFILGLISGMLMSFGIFKLYESIFLVTNEDNVSSEKNYPQLRNYPNPLVPHIEERMVKDEYASSKASFSCWVNAVNSYHPSWNNMSVSYTMHISLEGSKLRMRRPKNKIPNRILSSESPLNGITFVSERTVDLLYSKVHLLPCGLFKRRLWSKKYPICISLPQSVLDKSHKSGLTLTHSKSADNLEEGNQGDENLFFFTTTCREKEEIFRRFMAASLGMPINLTISDIVDKYLTTAEIVLPNSPVVLTNAYDIKDEDGQQREEITAVNKKRNSIKPNQNSKEPQLVTYVRYMAKFMPSDSFLLKMKSHNLQLNYVECDSELLWLNALVGRFAWDVFRGSFWLHIIKEKIRKKLRKLQLPYFIDKLEITDIDLGTELPVIRKVSRPYLDYRGLWVEFEVVYSGGFSMGLETKINLMRLKTHGVQHNQKSNSNSKQSGSGKSTGPVSAGLSDIGVLYVPEGGNSGNCSDKETRPPDPVAITTVGSSPESANSNNAAKQLYTTTTELLEPTSSATADMSTRSLSTLQMLPLQTDGQNEHHDSLASAEMDSTVHNEMILNDKLRMNLATGGGAVAGHKDSGVAYDAYELSSDDSYASGVSDSDDTVDKSAGAMPSSNKSFMNWLDKVTRSAYFKKASENKYVVKTMEYVSNTTLALQVNMHYLNGILVINIPPPPSDRLWWGFKKDPAIVMKAKPKVGQKEIHMTKIVEFIERKMLQEFKRVVVLPNMDDIAIPLLSTGDPDKYSQNIL